MMHITDEDDFDSGAALRANATPITLPDELAEWVAKNKELVMRVQNALSDTYDKLTEEQLWESIACAHSTEWRHADVELKNAKSLWADLNSPEKIPLGLIGTALDSDTTNKARDHLDISLANFTVIDEGLRQREDLSKLLSVMLVQKRMLERSTERTRSLRQTTSVLASLTPLKNDFKQATAPHIKPAENNGSQKTRGISDIFRLYANRFMSREKEDTPKNAPVPWSLKI